MDKKYHRGSGEVVVPETIGPNKNWHDLPHNVQCNKIEEFDEHIASLPIYAYCNPDPKINPVGWIEGEEVYQVRGQILREWEAVGKHLFDTHPEYLRRIWIEPKPKIEPSYYKRLKSAVEKLIELCDNTKQQYVSEIWQLRIGVVKEVLAELDLSRPRIQNNSKCGFYCQRDIEGDECCDIQCQHCDEYYGMATNDCRHIAARKDEAEGSSNQKPETKDIPPF